MQGCGAATFSGFTPHSIPPLRNLFWGCDTSVSWNSSNTRVWISRPQINPRNETNWSKISAKSGRSESANLAKVSWSWSAWQSHILWFFIYVKGVDKERFKSRGWYTNDCTWGLTGNNVHLFPWYNFWYCKDFVWKTHHHPQLDCGVVLCSLDGGKIHVWWECSMVSPLVRH